MYVIWKYLAHATAAFGVFWMVAFIAHIIGIYEDPRIVQMSGWERTVIVLWGLAAAEWWVQWNRRGNEVW